MTRCVAVIDGEHYPPVIEKAFEDLIESGREILAAVLVGGVEKLPPGGVERIGAVPVRAGDDVVRVLIEVIRDQSPDVIVDLSDEPVLDYRTRHQLAAVALLRGVRYEGADFAFEPPPRPRLARKPSLAVVSTGKRTGKTAITGFAARVLKERSPVIVAMGRGGPPEPEVLRGDELELSPQDLLAMADQGKHAASDYVEDALLGRVPTVGCRRCGGGLAGAVATSNVAEGVEIANGISGELLLLEGSGAAIPPVHSDVTCLVLPASIPFEYLEGYMGPYRVLLADLAVVTMCEEPFGSPSRISEISSSLHKLRRTLGFEKEPTREIPIIQTVFRPQPTEAVEGADVFVATTAPPAAASSIRSHLVEALGARVVGMTHSLSDRAALEAELDGMKAADVLLTEIKAAGVDVATRRALDAGMEVVYMSNDPVSVEGDLAAEFSAAADLAARRFAGASI